MAMLCIYMNKPRIPLNTISMKQFLRVGRIGFAIVLTTLSLFVLNLKTHAQTVSCNGYNPWVSTQVYTNETVFYENKLYQATWYNVNMVPPSNTSNGQPWVFIGDCSLPISPATTSCENLSTWSASVAYNGGAEVMWNGYKYTASFYNTNTQPDVNTNTPWKLIAACGSPASLTIGGTPLSTFTAFAASTSAAQSFTLTGSNLSNNVVTITAPANFEISLSQASGYTSSLQITPQSGSVSATIYVVYSPSGVGTDNGNIVISATGVTTQQIALTGTAQAIWLANGTNIYNANSGNVGIGTGATTPTEKLTVNGNGLFSGTLKATGITLSSGAGIGKVLTSDANGLASWQAADLSSAWKLAGNSNIDESHFIGTTNAKPIIFKTNNLEAMRILSNGKISIGDSYVPTDYKLSVNGKIIATEVAVFIRSQWPDYVFSSDHKLMTLGEVERYIKTHKHLPGMPAASEVETQGMKVGEINTLLVEKVEELTIHAIEHEKLIKEQKAMIDQLIELTKAQQERIEKLETK